MEGLDKEKKAFEDWYEDTLEKAPSLEAKQTFEDFKELMQYSFMLGAGTYKKDAEILKQLLVDAVVVLQYYGNAMNYTVDDYQGISGEMRNRVVLYGDSEEINDCTSHAGRRAREFLKKLENK